jgi:ABC-type phosphate transport system permease subunit
MIRNLTDAFAILCFGWPAIIVSILLAIAGLVMKNARLLTIAGVVFLPFTYYLSNGLRNPLVVTPFLLFASAFAIHRGKTRLVWLLLGPLLIVVLWLAFVVLNQ